MESKLVAYVNDPAAAAQPFDSSAVPKVSRAQLAAEASRKILYCMTKDILTRCFQGPSTLDTIAVPIRTNASPPPPTAAETQSTYAQQLAEVAELADYGPVLNSSAKPVQLTETETEYQVTCVKHIFKEHIVFQVRGRNKPCLYHDTDSGAVQCLEYPSGHRVGTGVRDHAAANGVRTDRRLYSHRSDTHGINITKHCLRLLYAGLARGTRHGIVPMRPQVHQ